MIINRDCPLAKNPFALSLSKGNLWFDKLTTNGFLRIFSSNGQSRIINTTYTKRLKSNTKSQHLALQRGFSLIELMISSTIGLLIMVALGSLFLNINRANNEMAKTNSQIENGRFAIQLLQEDIVHAGFWGTYDPQFDALPITGEPPNPCTPWTADENTKLIGIPLQVYGPTPPSGAGCVTDLAANKKESIHALVTDVLVVRHAETAETCVPGEANCEGKLYFQASQCENEQPYILNIIGTSAFDLHKRNCVTIAEKRKFISNIYYIRDYAQTVSDKIPTLMLSSFDLAGGTLAHQAAVPLIEGIESFHVELGIDGNGDGVPDRDFVNCTADPDPDACTADRLKNVVAVKIYVLARADKVSPGYIDTKTYSLGSITLPPFNDRFKRHVFSTTVRLNNISMRRETPP